MPRATIELEPRRERSTTGKWLVVLGVPLVVAFVTLLLVGFENALALLRYRVTIFLFLGPVLLLFLWCVYRAVRPRP